MIGFTSGARRRLGMVSVMVTKLDVWGVLEGGVAGNEAWNHDVECTLQHEMYENANKTKKNRNQKPPARLLLFTCPTEKVLPQNRRHKRQNLPLSSENTGIQIWTIQIPTKQIENEDQLTGRQNNSRLLGPGHRRYSNPNPHPHTFLSQNFGSLLCLLVILHMWTLWTAGEDNRER